MEAKRFKHKLHLKLPEHINFMRHNEKWKHTKKRGESLVIWINKQFLISSEINLRKRLLTLRFPVIFPTLVFSFPSEQLSWLSPRLNCSKILPKCNKISAPFQLKQEGSGQTFWSLFFFVGGRKPSPASLHDSAASHKSLMKISPPI